jgi:hypothetical protein
VTLTSDGAAASAAVGTYDITPSAATGTGLGNYNIGYVKGTLTVNPVPVLITYDFAATDPVDPVASLQGWTQIYRAPVTPDNGLWANYGEWGWMPDDGHLGDGWEVIDTLLGRSPAFTLNGTGDLTFQLLGSASPLAAPDVAPSAIPEIAITNGGFMGVALRDAAADTYVLSRGLSTNNYGNTWTDLSFTAAELAPYANDGKHYTLDFIDYSKLLPNGDGWIIMAGASIPGKLVPPPPELPPTGFSMEGGTTPTFVVPTVLGFQYRMVFKDLLTDGFWSPVGAWTDGTGADVTFTDPNTAGVPHRFYRLEVQ